MNDTYVQQAVVGVLYSSVQRIITTLVKKRINRRQDPLPGLEIEIAKKVHVLRLLREEIILGSKRLHSS